MNNSKDRIINAALEVFTSKGYAGSSMREISELSQVTKPTIYYYFKSKEGLYRALMEETLKDFELQLLSILDSGSVKERIFKVVRLYLDFCRKYPLFLKLFLMSLFRCDSLCPDINMKDTCQIELKALSQLLKEGMEQGSLIKKDPLKSAIALLGLINIQAMLILDDNLTFPVSSPEEVTAFFLEGMATT